MRGKAINIMIRVVKSRRFVIRFIIYVSVFSVGVLLCVFFVYADERD